MEDNFDVPLIHCALRWCVVRIENLQQQQQQHQQPVFRRKLLLTDNEMAYDCGFGEIHESYFVRRVDAERFVRSRQTLQIKSIRSDREIDVHQNLRLMGPSYFHAETLDEGPWCHIKCLNDTSNMYMTRGDNEINAVMVEGNIYQEDGNIVGKRRILLLRQSGEAGGDGIEYGLELEIETEETFGYSGRRLNTALYGEVRRAFRLQRQMMNDVETFVYRMENVFAVKIIKHQHNFNNSAPMSTNDLRAIMTVLPMDENPMNEIITTMYVSQMVNPYTGNRGHENITRYEGVYSDNFNMYVMMPFYNGGDLFDALTRVSDRRFNSMPPEEYQSCCIQLYNALHFLHHVCHVSHLDISVENVMLHNEDGRIRYILIDFGLARILQPNVDGSERLVPARRAGTATGKYDYYCPETVYPRGGNPAPYSGFATDIWQLSVLLMIISTGNKPYADPRHKNVRFTPFRGVLQSDIKKWIISVHNNSYLTTPMTVLLHDGKTVEGTTLEQYLPPEALRLIQDGLRILPENRFTTTAAITYPWLQR